jgi:hypothetical protein
MPPKSPAAQMAGATLLLNSPQRPAIAVPLCLDGLWDIMGLYGRQWEWLVNRWNDLEISTFAQISVITESSFFNRLQDAVEVEFQLVAVWGKKLILKFLLTYTFCSFLKPQPDLTG